LRGYAGQRGMRRPGAGRAYVSPSLTGPDRTTWTGAKNDNTKLSILHPSIITRTARTASQPQILKDYLLGRHLLVAACLCTEPADWPVLPVQLAGLIRALLIGGFSLFYFFFFLFSFYLSSLSLSFTFISFPFFFFLSLFIFYFLGSRWCRKRAYLCPGTTSMAGWPLRLGSSPARPARFLEPRPPVRRPIPARAATLH
jgi:hypothetical protein